MSVQDDKAKRCLAQGIALGNTLVRLEQAIKDRRVDQVRDLSGEFMGKAAIAECIAPGEQMRVQNASEALKSFGENGDLEGAKQALQMLRRDIGFPELVGLTPGYQAATPHKVAFGFGAGRKVTARFDGYRLVVNGHPEISFVPMAKGPETFMTQTSIHPMAKVELIPVKGPEPPKAVPIRRPTIRAEGPVGLLVERNESITGYGYIERIKKDGKVVQIKVFDDAGVLRQTIDKGNYQSLE